MFYVACSEILAKKLNCRGDRVEVDSGNSVHATHDTRAPDVRNLQRETGRKRERFTTLFKLAFLRVGHRVCLQLARNRETTQPPESVCMPHAVFHPGVALCLVPEHHDAPFLTLLVFLSAKRLQIALFLFSQRRKRLKAFPALPASGWDCHPSRGPRHSAKRRSL